MNVFKCQKWNTKYDTWTLDASCVSRRRRNVLLQNVRRLCNNLDHYSTIALLHHHVSHYVLASFTWLSLSDHLYLGLNIYRSSSDFRIRACHACSMNRGAKFCLLSFQVKQNYETTPKPELSDRPKSTVNQDLPQCNTHVWTCLTFYEILPVLLY